MSNPWTGRAGAGVMFVALLAASSVLGAPETLTARLDPSGMITISRGGVELGMIELNAHGPGWKHAPQATATAQASDLPGGGKRLVGTLPVPDTDGGALKFTESVRPLAQGLALEYDLAVTKTMKLNGLQFSLCLPVAVYAGKDAIISRLEGEPETMGFPLELPFQGWGGEAARIEVGKGTDQAIAVELRAATDAMIQDLRKWEHPVYEVRFPAISDDQGREVTTDDRFHLDLTVTLAGPVAFVGP